MIGKRISLAVQAGALKSYFPDSLIRLNQEFEVLWTATVTPSTLSAQYKIRLHYTEGLGVNIYVLSPKPLKLAKGKTRLPHVYNHQEQRLCLFYPKFREWDSSMLYVHSIIPWTCEWLLHYEIWAGTGDWRGEGIEH